MSSCPWDGYNYELRQTEGLFINLCLRGRTVTFLRHDFLASYVFLPPEIIQHLTYLSHCRLYLEEPRVKTTMRRVKLQETTNKDFPCERSLKN